MIYFDYSFLIVNHSKDTIKKIFEDSESEWISAELLGQKWRLLQTDFDPRTYGCKKLTDLVKKYTDLFKFEMRENPETGHSNMYVKLKNSK